MVQGATPTSMTWLLWTSTTQNASDGLKHSLYQLAGKVEKMDSGSRMQLIWSLDTEISGSIFRLLESKITARNAGFSISSWRLLNTSYCLVGDSGQVEGLSLYGYQQPDDESDDNIEKKLLDLKKVIDLPNTIIFGCHAGTFESDAHSNYNNNSNLANI